MKTEKYLVATTEGGKENPRGLKVAKKA